MKIWITFLFWFLFFNYSWATKDPVALFVRDFIKQTDNSSELYNYWYGTTNFNSDGGYIFRFDYDVTADGRKEAFIASSIFASLKEGGENWSIYSPSVLGDYQLIAHDLVFHPKDVAFNEIDKKETLFRFIKLDRDHGASLFSYRFFSDGKLINESRLLTEEENAMMDKDIENEEFKTEVLLLAKPYTLLDIKKILMADYIQQREPKWKKYGESYAPNQQYLDPADRESLQRAYEQGLSMNEALQAIIPKLDPKEIERTRRVANWKLRKGKELTEFESAVMGPDARKGKSPVKLSQKTSQKNNVVKSRSSILNIGKWLYVLGGIVVLLGIYFTFKKEDKSDV